MVNDLTVILLAAGSSSRFGFAVKKQWLYQKDRPLWQKVAESFHKIISPKDLIIVSSSEELSYMELFCDYTIIAGGSSRQKSLQNALEKVDTPYVMVSDVARCCLDEDLISRLWNKRDEADSIVPAIPSADTLYLDGKPFDRSRIMRIQTPQLSKTETLRKALDTELEYSDESSAIYALGKKVHFVEGSHKAHKLTHESDLKLLDCLEAPISSPKVGYGIDIHPFEDNKQMVLCGIEIDAPMGFKAHSDGDVALHAIIDALLGAAGMGDIGELFPDSDEQYKGADSTLLLKEVRKRINAVGLTILNCDITILAQTPRISPYKSKMRKQLAKLLHLPLHAVNIKATTAEKMGFVGRKEGVTVHAAATLDYYKWM